MSGPGWIWERLGLEPTSDARAIRKAYSARLKAIDVDADPAAFIALRQALEQATALAQAQAGQAAPPSGPASAAPEVPPGIAPGIRPDAPPPDAPPPEPPRAAPAGERPPSNEDVRFAAGGIDPRDMARLAERLSAPAADEAAQAEILALTHALLDRALGGRIDQAAELEGWMAAAIVNAIPRSDVMVEPAVAGFGWADPARAWRRSPAVDAVLQRQADLVFRAEIARRGSRWNRAFKTLSRPPPGGLGLVSPALRREVRGLLAVVASRHPSLVRDFAPESLAWWSRRTQARAGGGWAGVAARLPGGQAFWNPRPQRRLSLPTIAAVAFFPLLFCWFLLGRGYSARARVLAFGWLAAIMALGAVEAVSRPGMTVDLPPARPMAGAQAGAQIQAGDGDPAPPPRFADVCRWKPGASGGAPALYCRQARGGPYQAVAAPPGFAPDTQARAARGETAAMVALGRFYAEGPPIMHSGPTAASWFHQAADLGDSQGMLRLGLLNGKGQGVYGYGPNQAAAGRWYTAAAARGEPQAMYELAGLYRQGLVYPRDDRRAAGLYRTAADKGYAPAGAELGVMYEDGLGVARDQRHGAALIQAALAKGDPSAMFYMAAVYQLGAGVPRAYPRAMALYRDAASHGVTRALVGLGGMYRDGLGTPVDDGRAVRLFRQAADEGDAQGMYELGLMYRAGKGVPRSEAQGVHWLQAAADTGFKPAMRALEAHPPGRG